MTGLGKLFLLVLASNAVVVVWVIRSSQDKEQLDKDRFGLARWESLGFFDDIPNEEWVEFFQQPARLYHSYRNTDEIYHHAEQMRVPFWIFHNVDPYFTCPRMRLIGRKRVCDPDRIISSQSCQIYAFVGQGSRSASASASALEFVDDASQFFAGSCQIHVFGSHMQSPATNVFHHDWDDRESLHNIKKRLGHVSIDILLMDCEGCEWRIFQHDHWLVENAHQILLQTHDLPLPDRPKETKFGVLSPMAPSAFFDRFRANGYALFAKRVLSGTNECLETDWSFLRLRNSFTDSTRTQ